MSVYSNESNYSPDGPTVIVRDTEIIGFVAPCLVGLVILIGVVGNIFVILGLLSQKGGREQAASPPKLLHCMMQNVSACDLALLVFICPIFAAEFARGSWTFGRALCTAMGPLGFTAQVVSFYSLCFIAVDACYAVADPLGYQQRQNARVVGGLVLIVWAVAVVLTLPVWVFTRIRPTEQGHDICVVSWPQDSPVSFQLYGLVFAVGLPLATTVCCIIAVVINSNGKLWRPTPAESAKKTQELVNLMIALASSGALLCAPAYIVPFSRGTSSRGDDEVLSEKDVDVFFTLSCFAYAFGCVKPMLYVFANSEVCELIADLFPSRTGSNIRAIRNGLRYRKSPRCSPAKPARGQHYVDHRYPDTPMSTRSFPGSRAASDSPGFNAQDLLTLQFTEDGWRRKTL